MIVIINTAIIPADLLLIVIFFESITELSGAVSTEGVVFTLFVSLTVLVSVSFDEVLSLLSCTFVELLLLL